MTATIEDILSAAIGFTNTGQQAAARMLCEHAMASHPAHPAVLQLLALLDLQQGNVARAKHHAAASLALRADHVPTLLIASDVARAAGELHEALRLLERVVMQAPTLANAWFQIALIRQDLADLRGAAVALHEVLRIEPARADAEVNLGIVLQEIGQLEAAMQAYGRAYRLREATFGRIAHALATPNVGRLWLNLDDLRRALRQT